MKDKERDPERENDSLLPFSAKFFILRRSLLCVRVHTERFVCDAGIEYQEAKHDFTMSPPSLMTSLTQRVSQPNLLSKGRDFSSYFLQY